MAFNTTLTSCPSIPYFENGRVFDTDTCLYRVRDFLGNITHGVEESCMSPYFVHGLNTSIDNPYVTFEGCEAFCGKSGWYKDPGSRVADWIIPIFFLLSNIDLSPIDKRRFFAVIHALGDPIDTIWSLLDKLYAWHRCYEIAHGIIMNNTGNGKTKKRDEEYRTRIVATVFSGFEEVAGHGIQSEQFYKTVASTLGQIGTPNEDIKAFRKWRIAAVTMVDDRTNEFLRTGLAVTLYLFQVISEFVNAISGDPQTTPNGRIGAAFMLSWLIPATLISNVLGSFTSGRTCLRTMSRLVQTTNPFLGPRQEEDDVKVLVSCTTWEEYFETLPCLGAIYTFRPFKSRNLCSATGRERRARIIILLVSALPVALAFMAAFSLLWKANPNGFSCRHLWMTGVFTAWLLSAVYTSLLYRWVQGNLHWWLVVIKDTLIGLSSLSMVFLSVVGMFNSCYCWSLRLWLGEAAYFPLERHTLLTRYKNTTYPAIVTVFLGSQIIYVLVIVAYYRKGLIVNRWGEKHKRKEWQRIVGKWRIRQWNLFLFWTLQGDVKVEELGV